MSYKLQPGSPRDYRYDFMSWLNYAHRETAVSTEWCWSTSESLNLGNQARSQSSVFFPLPLRFSLFPFFHLHSLHRWLTCDITAPTSTFLVLCPTEAQIAVSQSSLFHTQAHTHKFQAFPAACAPGLAAVITVVTGIQQAVSLSPGSSASEGEKEMGTKARQRGGWEQE